MYHRALSVTIRSNQLSIGVSVVLEPSIQASLKTILSEWLSAQLANRLIREFTLFEIFGLIIFFKKYTTLLYKLSITLYDWTSMHNLCRITPHIVYHSNI